MKYEAHLTFPFFNKLAVQKEARGIWSFSIIQGDPELGLKESFCYLTSSGPFEREMMRTMLSKADAMEKLGYKPLRMKMEKIIYDSRD